MRVSSRHILYAGCCSSVRDWVWEEFCNWPARLLTPDAGATHRQVMHPVLTLGVLDLVFLAAPGRLAFAILSAAG